MMENILIVGAHFDDAELGAGGTAAKMVSLGKKVYKFTLTDNETHFAQRNVHVSFSDSVRQSAEAAKAIGMIEIDNKDPVPHAALVYGTKIMQKLESIIFDYHIDTILLHLYTDQ